MREIKSTSKAPRNRGVEDPSHCDWTYIVGGPKLHPTQ